MGDDVVNKLRNADNGEIREYRRQVREVAALMKAMDKDLQTLASYNTNDENLTMSFNDSDLDEVQRMAAARDAVAAWNDAARMLTGSPLLTNRKE